jgi:2,3-dihydroxy-p-cumate/2,3-dihydroxybenzoate 3,4-dioxygenase
MIRLHDIRYVRLGTRDLDAAARYATEILGLQLARREGRAIYLRSDSRDHTLVYHEGDPAQHVTGFEVTSKEELDAAAAELERLKVPVRHGSRAECDSRCVEALIAFKDPSGNAMELVWRPMASGWRYFPARDAGITGFSHIGLRTTDPVRDEQFWTGVCSARVSDRIGQAPLLRIDEVHHRLALFPSRQPGVQHVNHQVAGVDDVMRSWYFLREKGVRIVFGPGRHPTSSAIFLYFEGPDGMVYEYSTGVRLISKEEEATYQPRQFPFTPAGFCMWGSKPEVPEFRDRAPEAVDGKAA